MTRYAGVVTPPRRNPRRSAAANTRHDAPSLRSTAPNGRVTRSSARGSDRGPTRLPTHATGGNDSGSDVHGDDMGAGSGSGSGSDSDSEDELSLTADASFTQRRQPRRLQTIASTRERRQGVGQASSRSSRAFTVVERPGRKDPVTPKKNQKTASHRKQSPVRPQPDWPTSNVIPPWQQLEWTVLVQIFEYASYPLDSRSNIRWLLSAGLTCKTFLHPALKALYKCPMPQIISTTMGTKFANLMRALASDADAALARQDYRRTMVESLVVEVSSLPIHSQTRNFDVAELIMFLPSLSYVELFHEFDLPPYRKLDLKSKKWTYSPELLSAMKAAGDGQTGLRLKSWKWSERMMTPDLLEHLQTIHAWKTFSQLREVSFVNFQVPSLKEQKDWNLPEVIEEDKAYINLVASSLSSITNLKHLVVESSTLVDGQFLSLLPKSIEYLEIINCWEVTADTLSEYLVTHGRQLRGLTLHHNQSLNLTFLPLLGKHCPELRELSIDLLTYSHHEYYKDSDPMYETLLTVSDVPAWPKTIEVIEIEQMAKWDVATAEVFFNSFVDQAADLPKLRRIYIKAMLDVPWRQRSEFRDKWVRKLKRVFLRKAARPRSYHSLIQWPLSGGGQAVQQVEPSKADAGDEASPPRRSTRIASHIATSVPILAANEAPQNTRKRKRMLTSTTRDLRQRKRADLSYRDPDTDEDLDLDGSEESEEEADQEGTSPLSSPPASPSPPSEDEVFVHGLCDVVNIRFDNQKPREFQWGVEDFLDDDTHDLDDAEWTADREVDDDDDNYAW